MKQVKKIQLKTETIRVLAADQLAQVAGGTSAFACGPETFDKQTDRYIVAPRPLTGG